MNDIKFLTEVLIDTHQPELPTVWDGASIWIKAIVKVKLMGTIDAYCLAQRGKNGNVDIVKAYNAARITSIDAIYPYEFLDTTDNKVLNKVVNNDNSGKELKPIEIKQAIKELEPNYDLRSLRQYTPEQLTQVLIDIKAKQKISELNE